jgi:hypothetical protein
VESLDYEVVVDPVTGWGQVVNMTRCHTCNATHCTAMPEEEFKKMIKEIGVAMNKVYPIIKGLEAR